MPALSHVYCFQLGSEDCYKIGLTKNLPEERMRGFRTGSPAKFTPYRIEQTDHPREIEKCIHELLSTKRAENGEFFYASRSEVDAAFDRAVSFVAALQPLLADAERFRAQKPTGVVLPSTDDLRDTYHELQSARQNRDLLEQRIVFLEGKLQVAIGPNTGIDGIASWNWVDNWQLNLAAFKEEEPETYDALHTRYKHNVGGRRFCLAKGNLRR